MIDKVLERYIKDMASFPIISMKEASNKLKEAMPSGEWYKPILKLIEFTVKSLHKGLDKVKGD